MNSAVISAVNLIVSCLPSTRLFALKRWLWRACGVDVADGVSLNIGARIFGTGDVVVEQGVWIGIGCTLIVPNGASVRIGPRCDIAPDVLFECGSHDIGVKERRAGAGYAASIVVGAGCWIGARALLLGGAQIGAGSVIAAGSVVRKGVYPANVLLAGVPARIVRSLDDV